MDLCPNLSMARHRMLLRFCLSTIKSNLQRLTGCNQNQSLISSQPENFYCRIIIVDCKDFAMKKI